MRQNRTPGNPAAEGNSSPLSVGPSPLLAKPSKSTIAAWQRRYLAVWLLESASIIGTQIMMLALPLLAIVVLHAQPRDLGILGVAELIPVLLLSVPAGRFIDSHSAMVVGAYVNGALALVFFAVPIAALIDMLSMPFIVTVAFFSGSLRAIHDVALFSMLCEVVPSDRFVQASSRIEGSHAVAEAVGPGLAGVLVQMVGAIGTVLMSGVACAVTCVGLFEVTRSYRLDRQVTEIRSRNENMTSGFHSFSLIFQNQVLRRLTLHAAWFNCFVQMLFTLFPLYATLVLGFSSGELGLVLASGGSGGIVGSLLASGLGERLGTGRTMRLGLLLASLFLAMIPLLRPGLALSNVLSAVLLFLYGIGLAVFNVHSVAMRRSLAPPGHFATVMACYRFISFGALPLGSALAGILGERYGVREALLIASVACTVNAAVLMVVPFFKERKKHVAPEF